MVEGRAIYLLMLGSSNYPCDAMVEGFIIIMVVLVQHVLSRTTVGS